MAWVRIDDRVVFHQKTIAAGNEPFGAWVRMISHARGQGRGNFIDEATARLITGRRSVLARLLAVPPGCEAGFLEQVEGGYRFHGWEAFYGEEGEEAHATPLASRSEQARQAGRRSAEARREREGTAQPRRGRSNEGPNDSERTSNETPNDAPNETPNDSPNGAPNEAAERPRTPFDVRSAPFPPPCTPPYTPPAQPVPSPAGAHAWAPNDPERRSALVAHVRELVGTKRRAGSSMPPADLVAAVANTAGQVARDDGGDALELAARLCDAYDAYRGSCSAGKIPDWRGDAWKLHEGRLMRIIRGVEPMPALHGAPVVPLRRPAEADRPHPPPASDDVLAFGDELETPTRPRSA